MYKKILVPLDGSKRAEQILPHVENYSQMHHSEIILIQVVSMPIAYDGYVISANESVKAVERLKEETDLYLAGVAEDLKKKGLTVRHMVGVGEVVEALLRFAREEKVDLIAMASHGRGGLARVFYGSVAAGILHSIDRPLLLIRSRDTEAPS